MVLSKIINSKYMRMTKNEQWGYLSPEIEVYKSYVEQGFALSNMENIGNEKEPVEWN